MELFSYEEIFCKYYKFVRENADVFVSLNIDCFQSAINDQIKIFLYNNNKLDVANEKTRLDNFAVNSKLNERGWQIPCKIPPYISNFQYDNILFNREFA